ncbi:MAG: VOC family protein [Novosphingobium sp.]
MTQSDMLGGARHFQIGYVVRDIDDAIARFENLGGTLLDRIIDMRDDAGGPTIIQNLAHLKMATREIELIEARVGHASIYTDWTLTVGGIGLHHLGYIAETDEQWDVASRRWDTLGIVMDIDIPRVRVRYYDTRDTLGHYIELVQRRPVETEAGSYSNFRQGETG